MSDQSTVELPGAFCIGCHYPLRRLDPSTRNCPECGRSFDPDDPWSMNVARPIPRGLRPFLKPVRWLYPAVCTVVTLALLADVAVGGVIRFAWIVLGVLWLPVALTYYVRRSLRRWVVHRYWQNPELLRGDVQQLSKSRRLLALAVVLLLFRGPFYLVFLPSLPWLNDVAHREWAVKPWDAPRPQHVVIGLFPVREVRVDYTGVVFDTWLGLLKYRESDNGARHWSSGYELDDPLERVPW